MQNWHASVTQRVLLDYECLLIRQKIIELIIVMVTG